MEYKYKTKPFKHQREALRRSATREAFALFMEQGTGKSKVIIDNAAYLFEKQEIECLIVIAPNGVHRGWITDQIPDHLPDRIPRLSHIWRSGRASTKKHREAVANLLRRSSPPQLVIFAINIDAVITKKGRAAIKELLGFFQCMVVVDESTDIKNQAAQRTKAMKTLGKSAAYRRILSGTPVAEGPLGIFGQFQFLMPGLFGKSWYSFKHQFAEWRPMQLPNRPRPIQVLTKFKNLSTLKEMLDPHSYRVTKKGAKLNLPPKLYSKAYFPLSKQQLRIYNDLVEHSRAELADGSIVTVDMVLTKYLRLQQVTCGYVPGDDDLAPTVQIIEGPNPRMDALKRILLESTGGVIVWCRFRSDVEGITQMLRENEEGFGKDSFVTYDGPTSDDDRADGVRRFQDRDARFFIGNPKAGGKGLTLTAATTVVYYSSYFGLENRLQSEDRAHRIGQHNPVNYIDIVAEDTIDEVIVRALVSKKSVSDLITGDPTGDWL